MGRLTCGTLGKGLNRLLAVPYNIHRKNHEIIVATSAVVIIRDRVTEMSGGDVTLS